MLTGTDFFCGAGGSTSGAELVPGVKIVHAANHWPLAVRTHNTNHPHADHDCADISQVEPSRYPTTDWAWFSPECTNHSQAKGRTRLQRRATTLAPDANGETLPLDAGERSRATMWDVVRFTEYHGYKTVIVENVVEAAFWAPFNAWLLAMDALGYEHQIVFLNSAHVQVTGEPPAQSRDRIYVVFHRTGDRRPDVEKWTSPQGQCAECGHVGHLKRHWKPRGGSWPLERWGRYGAQYFWTCSRCRARTQPFITPAITIVDWSFPLQRIGDRERPLADKTMARIRAGLAKHRGEVLAVPVEGRIGPAARPMSQLLRTQTARAQTGICMPFITELRGGGSKTRDIVGTPLATVTASGNHHMLTVPPDLVGAFLMRNNGSTGDGGEHCTSLLDVARTITTKGHQSLVSWTDEVPAAEDCGFRMLQPSEVKAAMAFGSDYVLLGTRREQVRLAGNAVTPPAATCLVAAMVEALEGHVDLGGEQLDLAA